MKKLTQVLMLVACFGFGVSAQASLITVNAGDSALWNFDLTGSTPPPPYTSLAFYYNITSSTLPGTFTIFEDLNGAGTINGPYQIAGSALGGALPEWIDGVFSVQLALDPGTGSMSLMPYAIGYNNTTGSDTGFVYGVVADAAVPEPATLALFGIGLAGMGFARKKKKSA